MTVSFSEQQILQVMALFVGCLGSAYTRQPFQALMYVLVVINAANTMFDFMVISLLYIAAAWVSSWLTALTKNA